MLPSGYSPWREDLKLDERLDGLFNIHGAYRGQTDFFAPSPLFSIDDTPIFNPVRPFSITLGNQYSTNSPNFLRPAEFASPIDLFKSRW